MVPNFTGDLVAITNQLSNYEEKRNYISLSKISLPVSELIELFDKGSNPEGLIRQKCYKGYQMEKDLIRRLELLYQDDIKTDVEYSLAKGLIKGHPDFEYKGIPGEIKSVLMDEWIPNHLPPMKVMYQVHGYMYAGDKSNAIVIYESRESGRLRTFHITKDSAIMERVEIKIKEIIDVLRSRKLLGEV